MSTNDQTNRKGLQLVLATVPLLISFAVSIISYFAAVFIRSVYFREELSVDSTSNDGLIYLISYTMLIVIFGFWYTMILQNRAPVEDVKASTPKRWNPVKYWMTRLPILLLLGFGLQVFFSAVISILSTAAPDFFSSYKELIQSMSGVEVSWMTKLSVCLLAPIAEELLFRGVSLNYAKNALPIKTAILLQAVLFGIYHLNLIQFFYATVAGLILGMLAHQAGSIIPGIVLHVIINASAYFLPSVFIDNIPKASLSAVLGAAVVIPCCILMFKKPKKKKTKEKPKEKV